MKFAKATLLTVLTSGIASQALATNLVTNGSFETGDLTGWLTQPAGIGSDFGVKPEPTPFGNFCMEFSADGVPMDEISQILGTTMGQTYRISMWVKNYGIEQDRLQIGFGFSLVLDLEPVGTGLESWQYIETTAVAPNNNSRFAIYGKDNAAAFYVDDIKVEAVPEPMTMITMGAGFAGLVLRRRTARK